MTQFTSAHFIRKNTPELRNKLENMGYKILHSEYICTNGKPIDKGTAIITYSNEDKKSNIYAVVNIIDEVVRHGRIDCGENEQLFLALAALRSDSDKFQWFTDGEGNWRFSYYHGWAMSECIANDYDTPNWLDQDKWHKATPEELIEHFKEKQL